MLRGAILRTSLFYYILFTTLFFSFVYPLDSSAGREIVKTVETEGTCFISNDDITPARERAIDDSIKKAVQYVVGTLLSEDVVSEKSDVIDSNIYSKSKDYIQDYRILGESAEDGLYRVNIRAKLSLENIEHDLRMLGVMTDERQSEEHAPMMVVIMVSGIEKYGYLKMLRETLETGIREVNVVRLRKMGSDMVVMDAEMQGDTFELASRLTLKDFKGFSLCVTNITENTIEFNMVKEN